MNTPSPRRTMFFFCAFLLSGYALCIAIHLLVSAFANAAAFSLVLYFIQKAALNLLSVLAFSYFIFFINEKKPKALTLYAAIFAVFSFLRIFALTIIDYFDYIDGARMLFSVLFACATQLCVELLTVFAPVLCAYAATRIWAGTEKPESFRILVCSVTGAAVFFIFSLIEQIATVVEFLGESSGVVSNSETFSIILDFCVTVALFALSVLLSSSTQKRLFATCEEKKEN